jgi:DNA-directed RNA polymerase subunit K/omega
VIYPHPAGIGAFQFVTLASLRAIQLTRGCRPRIGGAHKNTVIAQLEVSQGKVVQAAVPQRLVRDTLVEV